MAKDRRAEEQLTPEQRIKLAALVATGNYDLDDLADRYGLPRQMLVRVVHDVNGPKRRIAAAVEEQFRSFKTTVGTPSGR